MLCASGRIYCAPVVGDNFTRFGRGFYWILGCGERGRRLKRGGAGRPIGYGGTAAGTGIGIVMENAFRGIGVRWDRA